MEHGGRLGLCWEVTCNVLIGVRTREPVSFVESDVPVVPDVVTTKLQCVNFASSNVKRMTFMRRFLAVCRGPPSIMGLSEAMG